MKTTYLDEIAELIRSNIPLDKLPNEDVSELLLMYAILARVKGASVSCSDVHDAWVAWRKRKQNENEHLIDFEKLPADVQVKDAIFVLAIKRTVAQLETNETSNSAFKQILFPQGIPKDSSDRTQVLELYKVMVQSSESLVGRRLGVNTFFLTMNGALLTGSGIIIQNSGGNTVGALGIAILSFAGFILCMAWRSLIVSFGQLNRGKFKVIQEIEQTLKAAIYAAEWVALGKGEDPEIYRSFTSREIWVPNSLLLLHCISCCTAIAVYLGFFKVH